MMNVARASTALLGLCLVQGPPLPSAVAAEYPGLRYLRAFDFSNSGERQRGHARKGDAFWFDDFSIAAQPPGSAPGAGNAGRPSTL